MLYGLGMAIILLLYSDGKAVVGPWLRSGRTVKGLAKAAEGCDSDGSNGRAELVHVMAQVWLW